VLLGVESCAAAVIADSSKTELNNQRIRIALVAYPKQT
jgi:hypothetical protein